MLKIFFAEMEDLEGYYSNLDEEKLTINNKLDSDQILKLIEKIGKDRPAHSQPVRA